MFSIVVPHSSRGFQTASTRIPIRTSSAGMSRIRCRKAMSAPSSRTYAETYGGVIFWPRNGTLTMQNVVTVPGRASSTSSVVATPSTGQALRGGT